MKALLIPIVVAVSAPAATFAVTDLFLPPQVASDLQAARSAEEIATMALRHPRLAATLMADAAVLGIAAPAGVVRAAALMQVPCPQFADLVRSAAEAAPPEADASALAGAVTCKPELIAAAAVDGVEAALQDGQLIAAEVAEIVAALAGYAPDAAQSIAAAVADATDAADDTAETLLAGAQAAIETADVGPGVANGRDRRTGEGGPPPFVTLPSAALNNPSPN